MRRQFMGNSYKILGISENAEIEEVKVAFQEKKKELQKQLLSKKPEEQKAAANQLQELVVQLGEDFAHILVQSGNHSRKLCMGMNRSVVSRIFPSAPGFIGKELFLVIL